MSEAARRRERIYAAHPFGMPAKFFRQWQNDRVGLRFLSDLDKRGASPAGNDGGAEANTPLAPTEEEA